MTLSRKDIVAIIGPADETLIADILHMDATSSNLAEAWAWINSDEVLIRSGGVFPTGKIAALVELLSNEQEFEDHDF